MAKCNNLSDSDKGKIMVASQLGQSISKATGFSGHSQYAMFLDMMGAMQEGGLV